jgi:chromosome segregation ATPase
MAVAIVRKSDGGDERDALCAAIAACAAVHAKAEQHRQAIHRARNMRAAAEAKLTLAGETLESARSQHAETLAQAAQARTAPKGGMELRSARQALADAEDEAPAARAALDRLEADGDDLDASSPQLENAVLVAVSQVVAPIAERLLAQMRQKQTELAILQRVFHVLTEDETIGVPVFNSDVQRLNAKDARMKPVAQLREEFFALNTRAGQDRAREAAAAWRKWRTALTRDPDAPVPEV